MTAARWLIPAVATVALVAIVIANQPPTEISAVALMHRDPTQVVGCSLGMDRVLRHAPRGVGKRVALTFDDGPSSYTPEVLKILRQNHVNATFFVVGVNVRHREWMLERMLNSGNEIGNHTNTHTPYANLPDISRASATIEAATGFTPCHFRPPEGLYDRSTLKEVDELGMSTIRWDVDTSDYSGLAAESIRAEVASDVRDGSIVLMHDGGGYRQPTVDALPGIIKELKRDGYEMVTVTELLGQEYERGPLTTVPPPPGNQAAGG